MTRFDNEADKLERETELLLEKGYFNADGDPIGGKVGKRIWAEVQAQLQKESVPVLKAKSRVQ